MVHTLVSPTTAVVPRRLVAVPAAAASDGKVGRTCSITHIVSRPALDTGRCCEPETKMTQSDVRIFCRSR